MASLKLLIFHFHCHCLDLPVILPSPPSSSHHTQPVSRPKNILPKTKREGSCHSSLHNLPKSSQWCAEQSKLTSFIGNIHHMPRSIRFHLCLLSTHEVVQLHLSISLYAPFFCFLSSCSSSSTSSFPSIIIIILIFIDGLSDLQMPPLSHSPPSQQIAVFLLGFCHLFVHTLII